jgi:ribonuclease HII
MSDDENAHISLEESVKKQRTPRVKAEPLLKYYSENPYINEIGVDEVGRGPLFGRVYTAAVILPKDDSFDHSKMKDSKKFHSKQKIQEVADYIKKNAIASCDKFSMLAKKESGRRVIVSGKYKPRSGAKPSTTAF